MNLKICSLGTPSSSFLQLRRQFHFPYGTQSQTDE